MKKQPDFSNPGTFEDMVFENRNKAYGAYDMNQNRRKYLVVAFFVSLLGFTSAVAVPFIRAINDTGNLKHINTDDGIVISNLPKGIDNPIAPPPLPSTAKLENQLKYSTPIIVEKADENQQLDITEDIIATTENIPVPLEINLEPTQTETVGIDEPKEEVFTFVEEEASFMGGGIDEFHSWVMKNITYPKLAIDNGIFGKIIIEFCVNSKGEVVDIKFLRSLDSSINNEALRVISSSPLWTPAKQGGRPVKQRFTLPVLFEMNK